MNTQLLAVVAVAMISLGAFGLIGLWAYSRLTRPPRRSKRRNSDLVVVHRFKTRKRRTMRPVPSPVAFAPEPADDSRWRRPGSPVPSPHPAPAIFGQGKPRHVRIDHTPRVIIHHTPTVILPHETIDAAKPHKPLSHATRPSSRTAIIKRVRVDDSPPGI